MPLSGAYLSFEKWVSADVGKMLGVGWDKGWTVGNKHANMARSLQRFGFSRYSGEARSECGQFYSGRRYTLDVT